MGEAKIRITAENHASGVINNVKKSLDTLDASAAKTTSTFGQLARQFGIDALKGIALSAGFFAMKEGLQLLSQAFKQAVTDVLDLEKNIVYATNTIDDMNISVGQLSDQLNDMSVQYATDVNTLAKNLRVFTREGNSASESMRLLDEAMRFSLATGEDFAATTEAINTAIEIFGLSYSDSVYILQQFNAIVDETNYSISDINTALSRSSINIMNAGANFEDIVDILYSLEEAGADGRQIILELKNVLEGTSKLKIELLPEDEVKSIEDKVTDLTNTTAFKFDQMHKQLDESFRGIVVSFGDAFGSMKNWVETNPIFKFYADPFGLKSQLENLPDKITIDPEPVRNLAEEFRNLTNAVMSASAEIDGVVYSLDELKTALQESQSELEYFDEELEYKISFHEISEQIKVLEHEEEIRAATKTRASLEIEMANTQEEQSYLKSKHTIIQAIEEQEEAEKKLQLQKDLAVTTKQIVDTTEQMDYLHVTHEITLEIQKQQDEVEKLQRISDQYSLSQQKNSLEILKIEYEAMGRRGGKLTRGEQYEISQIEQENALLQIQEMENQIAIGDIQTGALEQTQDELDAINRIHDESMYRSQIDDLNQSLSDMYERQEEYENEIAGLATSSLDSLNAQLDALEAAHDEYLYDSEMQRLQQALTEQQEQWQTYTDTINGIETNALQLLYNQLDALQEAHNEAMYNKEIEDLTNNLTEKYNLIAEYESAIETLQKQTALEVTTYLTGLSNPPSVGTSDQQNTLNTLLQAADAVTSGQDVLNTLFATSVTNQIPGWKWMQGGGHVYETGPYILHRGEEVLPSGKTENYGGNQITINMPVTIQGQNIDEYYISQKLRSAINKGLLDVNGKTNYRLR